MNNNKKKFLKIQLNIFCTKKENNRVKRPTMGWEKIFGNHLNRHFSKKKRHENGHRAIWINIRSDTINYIEKIRGTTVMDLGLREYFMNVTPKAREIKSNIYKWKYIKLKVFCTAKETSKKKLLQFLFVCECM